MQRKRIRILQMGKHFLYLPVYFARENNFFGLLPANVHVEIETADKRTDQGTYRQMIDNVPTSEYVLAVTDPIRIFDTSLSSQRKPAVLATLVTNGGFWAINHGSHQINGLRDLGSFERVIAYRPGTTSYNIAARIARDTGKTTLESFIDVVDPGNELLMLMDPLRGRNAVALSPDVLTIEELIEKKRASIELALGGTPEYNDVLVTALVSYNDFVSENREIVQAVVAALQKALLMIHLRDPSVAEYAEDYFGGDHTSGAIDRARHAGVLPLSTVVAQAHWAHAAKAYFEASHPGTTWTTDEEKSSAEYYRECVEPYRQMAEAAAKAVLEPTNKAGDESRTVAASAAFAAILAAGLSRYFGIVAVSGLALGGWILWWVGRRAEIANYQAIAAGWYASGIIAIIAFLFPGIRSPEIGVAFLIAAVGIYFVGYGIERSKRDAG